jgi:hypothetical protein
LVCAIHKSLILCMFCKLSAIDPRLCQLTEKRHVCV